MTKTEAERRVAKDAFLRGSLGIPDDAELQKMSFVELIALLSSCESGSATFLAVERETKKHLAKDQAKINRGNIVLGACIGLAGVFIGSFIRSSPPCNELSPANTVQQYSNSKLPVADVVPKPPAINPAPEGSNAQPRNPHP